jgi:copper chaperone CopZ
MNLSKMTNKQLFDHIDRTVKKKRRKLAALRNLLRILSPKRIIMRHIKGVAADDIIDVSGNNKAHVGTSILKDAKFKAPNIRKLALPLSRLELVNELDDYERIIQEMKHRIKEGNMPAAEKKAAKSRLAMLETLYDATAEDYDAALVELDEIASNNMPDSVRNSFESVLKTMAKEANQRDIKFESEMAASANDDTFFFTTYLYMEREGESQVIIAVTITVAPTDNPIEYQTRLYINKVRHQVDPRTLPLRRPVERSKVARTTAVILDASFAAATMDRLDLPKGLEAEDVQKYLESVEGFMSVEVDDDTIIVNMEEDTDMDKAAKEIFAALIKVPEVRDMRREKHTLSYDVDENEFRFFFK